MQKSVADLAQERSRPLPAPSARRPPAPRPQLLARPAQLLARPAPLQPLARLPGASAMAGRDGPLRQPPADHLAAEAARQAAEQKAWDVFRAAPPARFATQQRTQQEFRRPKKSQQKDWTVYTGMVPGSSTNIFQQHLVVPVLVPQPLAGPTPPIGRIPGTAPFQGLTGDTEHVTNIARMEALLGRHPEVGEVRKYKTQKALDLSILNADGRCRGHSGDGHQSPHDLRVSLAATGAVMELGCTVNKVKANSICLWWKPHAPFSVADQDKMCAIFFDVTEVAHLTPAECAH